MRAHRHLVAAEPLFALLLALSPGVALAGAPVDPTAEEVALAAMLQAGDLQASATSEGVTVGEAEDLPGYTENGGLREVRQTWSADGGVTQVFDFRWQFPDGEAAAAFLDAAEEELSEVSTGAERQSLPRRQRPLPDTRLYTFEDRLFGTGTVGFNYLMRQDNLVAKVYVSGDKDELSQAVASAIAQAAADRMVAALTGAGPVASPGGDQSPVPVTSPVPVAPHPSSTADLGAMVLRSSDTDAAGLVEYGEMRILRRSVWDFVETGFVDLPDVFAHRALRGIGEDLAASLSGRLADAGWQGQFRAVLGHSVDRYVSAAVISTVGEYRDEDGAIAAFDVLTDAIAGEDARAGEEPPAIGEQTALHTDTTDVLAYETARSTLTFRSGRYLGSVEVIGPADDDVGVATMEALGQRLADRIEIASASQATVLSHLALSLDLPAQHYIERYDVLDGDVLRFWDETDATFAKRAATYQGVTRVYRQDQAIPDGDKRLNQVPRFSVSVHLFPDAEAASAWLAGVPSRRGLVPLEGVRQFGEESLTVAEAYELQGISRTGFRIYIRVGSIVATPTIDGPEGLELAVLEDLAALQAECLVAGSCVAPPAVPAELLP